MITLDIPKSGKCGTIVAYPSRYGQCQRAYIIPRNRQTLARQQMRAAMGHYSRAWSTLLTQVQREAWNLKAPAVQSHKRLGQSGPLSGQMHFVGINTARACIGRDALWAPPEPVAFGLNPVGQLAITRDERGLRLLLEVTSPVTEDIMVFGQAPCSAGRTKRRNVAYLGLLPAPVNGQSDITDLYTARYGAPPAGQRIFIVTRQQKDGWERFDQETNEIVPPAPKEQAAAATPALSLQLYMHKGCTRDADENNTLVPGLAQASSKASTTEKTASRAPSTGDSPPNTASGPPN